MNADILIWVGREFYLSSDDYIKEALAMGCSRKVAKLPKGLVLGESKVYLCHKEERTAPVFLFGWYTVDGVIQCSKIQAEDDLLRDTFQHGIPIYQMGPEKRAQLQPRGCGVLDPPSLYLVGPDDMTVQLGLRPPTGRNLETGYPRIHVYDPALPLKDVEHFLGFKMLDDKGWGEILDLEITRAWLAKREGRPPCPPDTSGDLPLSQSE